jgi:hypothetical protein
MRRKSVEIRRQQRGAIFGAMHDPDFDCVGASR